VSPAKRKVELLLQLIRDSRKIPRLDAFDVIALFVTPCLLRQSERPSTSTPRIHRAFASSPAASDRSISDVVNEAVKRSLAEDADDLAALDKRAKEPVLDFGKVVAALKAPCRYSVSIKRTAARELEAVARKGDRQRLVARIRGRSQAIHAHPACEKLAGHTYAYRVRQGDYRVLYTVDDAERSVVVFKIGHRREVYR